MVNLLPELKVPDKINLRSTLNAIALFFDAVDG
jgi:hypothetical protein